MPTGAHARSTRGSGRGSGRGGVWAASQPRATDPAAPARAGTASRNRSRWAPTSPARPRSATPSSGDTPRSGARVRAAHRSQALRLPTRRWSSIAVGPAWRSAPRPIPPPPPERSCTVQLRCLPLQLHPRPRSGRAQKRAAALADANAPRSGHGQADPVDAVKPFARARSEGARSGDEPAVAPAHVCG